MKIASICFLLGIIFIIAPQHSYGKTHIRARVDTSCFTPQGLSYLSKLSLNPQKIAIHDTALHFDMASFINQAAFWDIRQQYYPARSLIAAQFNASVKYLAPIVADLSNKARKLQSLLWG